MIICDLTHAYTPTSGGIRTYIDAKRAYLREHTDHTHVLIAPGAEDSVEEGPGWCTLRLRAPTIPGAAPYRFFTSRTKINRALAQVTPDVIELHSWYLEPWAALAYRANHPSVRLAGYFFTDIPEAYIGAPVRRRFGDTVAAPLKRLAERYMGHIFRRCDLALAPSPRQAARLRMMGVASPYVLRPGVDLDLFHPSRADRTLRARLGIPRGTLMLFYAGRLDREKHIRTLVEATRYVNRSQPALLVLAGEGPLREALNRKQKAGAPLRTVGHLRDRRTLATHLATADMYVTAGPHETFGFSVAEAQACGLPVVGVAAGALTERVPRAVGRLGPVDDAETMAAHIIDVTSDQPRLRASARAHAATEYSWAGTFEKSLSLYAHGHLPVNATADPASVA